MGVNRFLPCFPYLLSHKIGKKESIKLIRENRCRQVTNVLDLNEVTLMCVP